MISTSDFKRGSTKILWKGEPWLVIEFQHVKPGKGGAFVRTKMRNLITGRTFEETFRSGEKFGVPDLEFKKMQYLYSDGTLYNFMEQEEFEQMSFTEQQVAGVKNYLKEEETYQVVFFEGKPISVEPPTFMVLEVTETVPGVRGNTAQGGATKPATLETGLVVQVPLFINEGEKVKVDTRSSQYVERAEQIEIYETVQIGTSARHSMRILPSDDPEKVSSEEFEKKLTSQHEDHLPVDIVQSVQKLSRRDIRALAFHLVYAMEQFDYSVSLESIVDNFNRGFDLDIPLDSPAIVMARGAIEIRQELDEIIKSFLKNWKIERLGCCTRLILRLGLWELLQPDAIPSIVINEAVELAKAFAEKDAYKFVNGVLDEFAKSRDKKGDE